MNKQPIAAGYMIQDRDGYAIQSIGSTDEEAWQELVANAGPFFDAEGNEKGDELAREEDFRTFGATAALIQKVKEYGGVIRWDVINGVACTIEESEALQGD